MALINCPECGKNVSTRAGACPHCGCPANVIGNQPSSAKDVGSTRSTVRGTTPAPEQSPPATSSRGSNPWPILAAVSIVVIAVAGYFLVQAQNEANVLNAEAISAEQRTARQQAAAEDRQADIAAEQCYQDKLHDYYDQKDKERIAQGKEPLGSYLAPSGFVMSMWQSSCNGW